ncbi:TetR/AcrR family transcriptional regulator [Actinocorallia sp. API 0066]|uniref:TetR/AcrR family transcriptional regulator n=1 Tax=Actinocorallia sp. API 0066 TaxID=2896846 RepID=UPI001E6100E5|nr:TetR/AcrR family transcriptional regulator [Actinocorallia sp. API 0066]MCD0453045.1 TetR/AcrR family transcriptional regulator [Actinocorallia sp. API 0066]
MVDPDQGAPPAEDRLYRSALTVFAGLGYDNATVEMIADTAGVDRSAVRDRGGKEALYREVLTTFSAAQEAMLDRAAAEFTRDREGVRRFLDTCIAFHLDHAQEMSVWQHRRLRDAADMGDIESLYQSPVVRRICEIAEYDVRRNPGFEAFANFLSWAVRGFLFGGVTTVEGETLDPESPAGRRLFHDQLRWFWDVAIDAGVFDPDPAPD